MGEQNGAGGAVDTERQATPADAVALLMRAHKDSTAWRENPDVYVDPIYVTYADAPRDDVLFLTLLRGTGRATFRVTVEYLGEHVGADQ